LIEPSPHRVGPNRVYGQNQKQGRDGENRHHFKKRETPLPA
jgi:hypothetical protein